jgi:hypothetical protein
MVVPEFVRPLFVAGVPKPVLGVTHSLHRVTEFVVELEQGAVGSINVLDPKLEFVKGSPFGVAHREIVRVGPRLGAGARIGVSHAYDDVASRENLLR